LNGPYSPFRNSRVGLQVDASLGPPALFSVGVQSWIRKGNKRMTRILVTDDDVQIRQMLRQMLEHAGYEVVEAADGDECTRRVHENKSGSTIVR